MSGFGRGVLRGTVGLVLLLAGPAVADTPPVAPAETVAPACTSCDARKAGLKKLKAAREVAVPPPTKPGDS